MNQEHLLTTLIKSGEGSSLEFKKCRNMMKYCQAYGGDDPQMIEGDVFRIIVTVPEFGAVEKKSEQEVTGQKVPTGEVTGEVQRLVQSIRGKMSRVEIQRKMKLKHEDYFREAYLMPALNSGFIDR